MQIFQWLFKLITPEQSGESTPYQTNKKIIYGKDVEARDIILYKQREVNQRRSKRVKESDHHHRNHYLGGKYWKPFAFLCRKDVADASFCNTLNLRKLGSINRRRRSINSMNKMKKDQESISKGLGFTHHYHHHKAHDSTTGSKVLPITDASTNNEQCGQVIIENKKDNNNNNNNNNDKNNKIVNKGDHKNKTMSRMKELLRWAAAAKSAERGGKFLGRKVLHFRNRATLKRVPDEDQLSIESPKISFRWDMESNCSISSSVYSGISMASSTNNNISVSSTSIHCTPRKGNWITTDSEFVVLEL